MLFWFVLALITGAAVLAVLWPLSSRAAAMPEPNGEVAFYAAQLAEIDRDRDRGLIGDGEAKAARVESSRRLLRAADSSAPAADLTSEPALRRRRAASALALSIVPIVGLAVYGVLGSPHLLGQGRSGSDPSAGRLAEALGQLEAHLVAHPADLRGWDLVGPIYLRIGRSADAAMAFGRARSLGGDTPARLTGEAEGLAGDENGAIGEPVRALLRRALALDAAYGPARYYLALASEQDGDRAGALAAYRGLAESAAPDAAWLPVVRARIAALDTSGPRAPFATGAIPPEIAGMVEGLDTRLAAGGGSEAEWGRLIRSLAVLGRRGDALERADRARSALAADPTASARIDRLVVELGLNAEARAR